jgi:SAM-dependent methyltransferase
MGTPISEPMPKAMHSNTVLHVCRIDISPLQWFADAESGYKTGGGRGETTVRKGDAGTEVFSASSLCGLRTITAEKTQAGATAAQNRPNAPGIAAAVRSSSASSTNNANCRAEGVGRIALMVHYRAYNRRRNPMTASIVYRNRFFYETVMLVLYGPHYLERSRTIASLIPQGSSVVDLCCGPGTLYHRYLRRRDVTYTGLDMNRGFIEGIRRAGASGIVCDVAAASTFPRADYVVMQASLYHFLPDPGPIVNRMVEAAGRQVLIAEPIRNLSDSSIPVVASAARRMTNPGTGPQERHFTEQTLDAFFDLYDRRGCVSEAYRIAGGREKLYLLKPASRSS